MFDSTAFNGKLCPAFLHVMCSAQNGLSSAVRLASFEVVLVKS